MQPAAPFLVCQLGEHREALKERFGQPSGARGSMAERQLERFASIHRPAFRVGAAQTTQAPRTVGGPFDRMLGGAELVQNE